MLGTRREASMATAWRKHTNSRAAARTDRTIYCLIRIRLHLGQGLPPAALPHCLVTALSPRPNHARRHHVRWAMLWLCCKHAAKCPLCWQPPSTAARVPGNERGAAALAPRSRVKTLIHSLLKSWVTELVSWWFEPTIWLQF